MKTKIASFIVCALLSLAASRAAAGGITLSDFKLTGDLGGEVAAFTLTANAKVEDAKGGALELLSGPVALTGLGARQKWQMTVDQNRFVAKFDRSGTFPIEVHFNAAVTRSNDWRAVDFRVATSALQPVVLQGLAADTEFQFASAARPERTGTNFISYLPVDGAVNFAWKQARPEAEGKLFYAAEMTSQISVSPGLMRQAALLNGKIMQGEMNRSCCCCTARAKSRACKATQCWLGMSSGKFGAPSTVSARNNTATSRVGARRSGGPAARRPIQPAAKRFVRDSGANADAARRVSAVGGRDSVAARRRDAVRRHVSAS